MVQVLPYIPSFGERIPEVLSRAIGDIGQAYSKQSALQQLMNLDSSQAAAPSSGSVNNLNAQGQSTNQPQPSAINQANALAKEYELRVTAHGKPSADAWKDLISKQLDRDYKEGADIRSEERKIASQIQAKERELQQGRDEISPAFETLDQLIPYTGRWGVNAVLGKLPYTEANEKRNEFDKLGFWATDKVYTHFNKGTITDKKLELIKNELSPRAELSERENKARISALKRISGLPSDISAKKLDAVLDSEIKKTKQIPNEQKVPKGTKITDEIVQQIMAEANNDKKEARRIARELGYDIR